MRKTIAQRLMNKVVFSPDGCWLSTSSQNGNGYSQVFANGKERGGHRVSYELFVGPIPEGLVLDHLCRVRHCVNPLHLEPVTHRENIMRGEGYTAHAAKVTVCPRGHAYDEENTLHCGGKRYCRMCQRAKREARKAAA